MNSTENTFVNEPDRVILYDDLGSDVAYDTLWSHADCAAKFLEEFEVFSGKVMSDPTEDFYRGVNLMRIIRRKADGRLFGFPYWAEISKHGTSQIEPNGYDHGFEFEWNEDYYPSLYVFMPIEPFTITGYQISEEK